MSKFSYAVYPVIAAFSLAAAVSAHAQNVNDPTDQAAYGATVVSTTGGSTAAVAAKPATTLRALRVVASAPMVDSFDQAAYGPTVFKAVSVRSRAEVHAEAVAAARSGEEALFREGADPKYAVLPRAKSQDAGRSLAAAE